jgi:hypothetical protein
MRRVGGDLVRLVVYLNRQVRPAIAVPGKQRGRDSELHRHDACLRYGRTDAHQCDCRVDAEVDRDRRRTPARS